MKRLSLDPQTKNACSGYQDQVIEIMSILIIGYIQQKNPSSV